MTKTETITLLCHNGQNNDVGGIPVEFKEGVLEMVRTTPCPGCLWRHSINFEKNKKYEGFIDLNTVSAETVKLYYEYVYARHEADNESKNGGYFNWEQLLIARYPNIDPDSLACWIENKKEK